MSSFPDFFVLRRYPHLRELLPAKCQCGAMMTLAKEFSDAHFAGVETHPCVECGAQPMIISCHTVKAENDEYAALIRGCIAAMRGENP